MAFLFAMLFAGVGTDWICELFAPFDYLGIPVPQIFYICPILTAVTVFGLIFVMCRIADSRPAVFRGCLVALLAVLILSATTFYSAFALSENKVEFLPLSNEDSRTERSSQFEEKLQHIEHRLGFKIGLQSGPNWRRLFFNRVPGRREQILAALGQDS